MRPGPVRAGGRGRGGVAPALLLDVLTPSGRPYYWADRPVTGVAPAIDANAAPLAAKLSQMSWDSASGSALLIFTAASALFPELPVRLDTVAAAPFLNGVEGTLQVIPASPAVVRFIPLLAIQQPDQALAASTGTAVNVFPAVVTYRPWLLGTGTYNFNRSTNTDTGTLTVQNLSGDALASEFERIVRRSTLEGSLFVLRYYALDLEHAWIEQHGTLTVGDTLRSSATLQLQQLLQGQDDTPAQDVSENCQIVWGEKRCGATGPTECLYTYGSCQVVEHFVGIQTAFEVNNPAALANLPAQTINRRRAW